jgi:hypothetical protein
MNFKATIILCVIAVIGVTAAVVVEQRAPSSTATAETSWQPLIGDALPAEDRIDRIALDRHDEPPIVFERWRDGWRQVEPFNYPVDGYSVQQLITRATELRSIQQLDEAQFSGQVSESTLGLKPPRAVLRFAWSDGSLELELGRRGVAGRAYARVAGEQRVHVVNGELHERAVDADVREWRDRRIFHNAGIESDEIVIAAGDIETVLQRERKRWTVAQPVETRVNNPAFNELLQALGRARHGGFILDRPDDLRRFGLADPAGAISVTSTRLTQQGDEIVRRKQSERLVVGSRLGVNTQDRFGYVEGRPTVIRLPQAVVQAFFLQPRQLVSPVPSGAGSADVKSIRIIGVDEFMLTRNVDRWFADASQETEAAASVVDQLLEILTQARAEDIEIREYPRDLEVAVITLIGYDGRPLDTVRIAREVTGEGEPGRWALENGDDVLRIFPASLRLPLSREAFGVPAPAAEDD